MIDGAGSKPFSARSLDPIVEPHHSYAKEVLEYTRKTYGRSRFSVEEEINKFYTPKQKEEKKPREEGVKQKTFEQSVKVEEHKNKEQEEKILKVRKITNTTPLPPRPIQTQGKVEHFKKDPYHLEREIEEEFHKPPKREDRKIKNTFFEKKEKTVSEPVLQKVISPKNDHTPNTSLKDALKKAMDEHREEQLKSDAIEKKETIKEEVIKKEVSEETLRKVLSDEE
jgi:hypothetical protein